MVAMKLLIWLNEIGFSAVRQLSDLQDGQVLLHACDQLVPLEEKESDTATSNNKLFATLMRLTSFISGCSSDFIWPRLPGFVDTNLSEKKNLLLLLEALFTVAVQLHPDRCYAKLKRTVRDPLRSYCEEHQWTRLRSYLATLEHNVSAEAEPSSEAAPTSSSSVATTTSTTTVPSITITTAATGGSRVPDSEKKHRQQSRESIQKLQQQLSEVRDQLSMTKKENAELQATVTEIGEHVQTIKYEHDHEKAELQRTIDRLQQEVTTLRQDRLVKVHLSEMHSLLKEKLQQIADMVLVRVDWEASDLVQSVSAIPDEVRKQLNKEHNSVSELRKQLEVERQAALQQVDTMRQLEEEVRLQMEQRRKKLNEVVEENSRLKDRYQSALAELNELSQSRNEFKLEVAKLKASSQKQELNSRLELMEKECQSWRDRFEERACEMARLTELNGLLETDVSELQAKREAEFQAKVQLFAKVKELQMQTEQLKALLRERKVTDGGGSSSSSSATAAQRVPSASVVQRQHDRLATSLPTGPRSASSAQPTQQQQQQIKWKYEMEKQVENWLSGMERFLHSYPSGSNSNPAPAPPPPNISSR